MYCRRLSISKSWSIIYRNSYNAETLVRHTLSITRVHTTTNNRVGKVPSVFIIKICLQERNFIRSAMADKDSSLKNDLLTAEENARLIEEIDIEFLTKNPISKHLANKSQKRRILTANEKEFGATEESTDHSSEEENHGPVSKAEYQKDQDYAPPSKKYVRQNYSSASSADEKHSKDSSPGTDEERGTNDFRQKSEEKIEKASVAISEDKDFWPTKKKGDETHTLNGKNKITTLSQSSTDSKVRESSTVKHENSERRAFKRNKAFMSPRLSVSISKPMDESPVKDTEDGANALKRKNAMPVCEESTTTQRYEENDGSNCLKRKNAMRLGIESDSISKHVGKKRRPTRRELCFTLDEASERKTQRAQSQEKENYKDRPRENDQQGVKITKKQLEAVEECGVGGKAVRTKMKGKIHQIAKACTRSSMKKITKVRALPKKLTSISRKSAKPGSSPKHGDTSKPGRDLKLGSDQRPSSERK